jgi:DNA-binding NarL/FixJ family response regulator
MIKIVVVDNTEADRNKIKEIISSQSDFEIVQFGKDGYEAINIAASKQPDIVILGTYVLKSYEGRGVIRVIKGKSPKTRVILLAPLEDVGCICGAINNEASVYHRLEGNDTGLCNAIREVYQSGRFISPKIVANVFPLIYLQLKGKSLLPDCKAKALPPGISKIEKRIAALIASGYSTQEIADKLEITPGTVRNHISMVMQKAGVHNRNQIALFAFEYHLTAKGKEDREDRAESFY